MAAVLRSLVAVIIGLGVLISARLAASEHSAASGVGQVRNISSSADESAPVSGTLSALSASAAAYVSKQTSPTGVAAMVRSTIYGQDADRQFPMASLVKIPIMLAFLNEEVHEGDDISDADDSLIQTMIENSDNDSASELWDLVGGGAAVQSYVDGLGITGMSLNTGEAWGDSTTSAQALATLLYKLAAGELLDTRCTEIAVNLLRSVEPDQRWGVPGPSRRPAVPSP